MNGSVTSYFAGKRILITGAASGIGAELSAQMLGTGAYVRVADWSEERLEKAKERFKAFGEKVSFYRVDVSKKEQVDEMVEKMAKDFAGFDMIVNNAGILDKQPVERITIERFRQVIDVNFWGVIYGCYAALPIFLSQGHGHIVNISSLGGILHGPFQAAYGASKSAVLNFSDTLRYEMELQGVDVTTVCPGDVQSGLLLNSTEGSSPEHHQKLVEDKLVDDGMGAEKKSDIYEKNGMVFASTEFACSEIVKGIAQKAPIILTPREYLREAYHMDTLFPYYYSLDGQDGLRAAARAQKANVEKTGNAYGLKV